MQIDSERWYSHLRIPDVVQCFLEKAGAKEMALLYNARKINNYARLTNFQGLDDSLSLKK